MLKTRTVVEKGAWIAISNGDNINIWNSPWIPSLLSLKTNLNPNLVDLSDFNVADLLNTLDRT